jgi:hypothetical protein
MASLAALCGTNLGLILEGKTIGLFLGAGENDPCGSSIADRPPPIPPCSAGLRYLENRS